MSIMEKAAYLRGLAEGLGFDPESKEGKLFSAIIDTLSEMAEEIDGLLENALDIGEELDALSDDLADIEEFLFADDDDDDDDDDFGFFGFDDDDDDDDDDECGCAFCGGDDFSLEIECPKCGVETEVTEADLLSGSVTCVSCGEVLEIEFDENAEDEDEEDDAPLPF